MGEAPESPAIVMVFDVIAVASGALLCGAKAKVMMTATSGQNPAESANAASAASPIAPCPTVPVEEKTPELIVDPPAAATSRLMANVPSVMTACDSGAAMHSHANTTLAARIIALLCTDRCEGMILMITFALLADRADVDVDLRRPVGM